LVKSLLQAQADVNHQNAQGYNSLAIAVEKYRVDAAIELLSWGASIGDADGALKENMLHVALYRAEQTENCRLLTELVAHGALPADSPPLSGQSGLIEKAIAVGKERFHGHIITVGEVLLDHLPRVLSDICICYLLLYAPESTCRKGRTLSFSIPPQPPLQPPPLPTSFSFRNVKCTRTAPTSPLESPPRSDSDTSSLFPRMASFPSLFGSDVPSITLNEELREDEMLRMSEMPRIDEASQKMQSEERKGFEREQSLCRRAVPVPIEERSLVS